MNVWVEAARPRTLPAAVVPVAVGTATAVALGTTIAWDRAVLALVVALALQVAVNFANDLFDGLAGIDTEERVGPRRVVAAGLVTPGAMERALALALAVAGVAGLVLALLVTPWLLLVGVAAIVRSHTTWSECPPPAAQPGTTAMTTFGMNRISRCTSRMWSRPRCAVSVGSTGSAADAAPSKR